MLLNYNSSWIIIIIISSPRVLGILAVSRSFGDHGMKDFVVATPHVVEKSLNDGGHYPFVILACDGVWDVMTDQEAVELIISEYGTTPSNDAADLLVSDVNYYLVILLQFIVIISGAHCSWQRNNR